MNHSFFFLLFSPLRLNRYQKLLDNVRRQASQCAWWRVTTSTRLAPSPLSAALSSPAWITWLSMAKNSTDVFATRVARFVYPFYVFRCHGFKPNRKNLFILYSILFFFPVFFFFLFCHSIPWISPFVSILFRVLLRRLGKCRCSNICWIKFGHGLECWPARRQLTNTLWSRALSTVKYPTTEKSSL